MGTASQIVTIDGHDTRNYGISVMKIKGAFDMPGRLSPNERDWQDVDGVEAFVEYSDMFFKQRQISLECVMEAANIQDLQFSLGQFRELVYTRFTMVTPFSTHDCVMKMGAKVKIPNDKYGVNVVARFTLVMNEISYDFGSTLTGDPDITNDWFWLDNIKFSDFGILVESADGNFDFPKMKTDRITKYKRESDKVNKRETRDILLKCTMRAVDIATFQTQMDQFHALLAEPELRKLMMPIPGLEKPYEVYPANGFKIREMYYADNQVNARFDLVLREASPSPEAYYLSALQDTNGDYIVTTTGAYIYVIANREETKNQSKLS